MRDWAMSLPDAKTSCVICFESCAACHIGCLNRSNGSTTRYSYLRIYIYSTEVRIRVPFFLWSILVGELSPKKGSKGTTEGRSIGLLVEVQTLPPALGDGILTATRSRQGSIDTVLSTPRFWNKPSLAQRRTKADKLQGNAAKTRLLSAPLLKNNFL